MKKLLKPLALIFVIALLASACGQKSGVHRVGSGGPVAGQATEAGEDVGLGDQGSATDGAGEVLDSAGNPVSGSGGGSGGGSAARVGSSGGGAPSGIAANPNDRVGITKTSIRLGLHAPLTGAAAVDLNDLKFGNNVFTDFLEDKKATIHGRIFEVTFKDDQYSPSIAVSVCREMVEKNQVFLLFGAAGTDQIQACARYANQKKIPYISSGVTEKVVSTLPNYLALFETYPDQTVELAKLIRNFDAGANGGKVYLDRCNAQACNPTGAIGTAEPKVAIVYSNTEGFHDARDEFLKHMGALIGGADKILQVPITKFTISASEANATVSTLKSAGTDVVFIITAPTNFGNILTPAQGQGFFPRWVGVGLTMGLNLVAAPACARQRNAFEFSIFFHPSPSVLSPIAAQWRAAWARWGGPQDSDKATPEVHDIAFALWGLKILEFIIFHAMGPDPTRSGFISTAQKLKAATAPDSTPAGDIVDVIPPITFSPTDKFGGESMHILWADCNQAIYNFFDRGGKVLTSADL